MSDATTFTARCYYCGSRDVRPSNSKAALDIFFAIFGRTPCRCRACQRRIHVRGTVVHREAGSAETAPLPDDSAHVSL